MFLSVPILAGLVSMWPWTPGFANRPGHPGSPQIDAPPNPIQNTLSTDRRDTVTPATTQMAC